MGLTEGHWFENEDAPENYERALEDAVFERSEKKQEPVAVQQREMMHMLFWCCGSCGVPITEGDKFCRMCGKAVKWNDQKKIEKIDHVLRGTAE